MMNDDPNYFSNVSGPLRHDFTVPAISVLGDPNDSVTIGIAYKSGKTADGHAAWRLAIQDRHVPGFWVVIGRRFHAVHLNHVTQSSSH
jgi:hypothetical protein